MIESSLERLQLFKYFLLNSTASTVDSILESSTNILNILNNDYKTNQSLIYESIHDDDKFITDEDINYVNNHNDNTDEDENHELKDYMIKVEMKKLWQLYLDLTEDIKIQEVTTPALSLTPKIRGGERQRERVKSPLANSRTNRFF